MKNIFRISKNSIAVFTLNMKARITLILFFMFLLQINASNTSELGQVQSNITGTVTDQTGLPLPGVNIIIVGTNRGTQTDFDGNYSIEATVGDVISYSYLGMLTITSTVGSSTTIDIAFQEDTENILDEVVVVGYGTQKKVNLTGSLSTVKADDVKDRPFTKASQMLSGMASGVTVLQQSGKPGGDGAFIRIRGIGTLGNNNPLVLVDGVISSLDNVSPNDIETLTVLKDAASSAIYGARSANGVILITTTKGKVGKLQVDFDIYTGVQEATRLTDYVTNSVEFMELKNLAINNEDPTSTPLYSQDVINEYRNGSDPYLYPNTDWNNEMYRSANISSYNMRIGGGTESTQYSFSLGYIDQKGVLLGTSAEQFNVRMNLNSQISKKFNIKVGIAGRHDDVHDPVNGASTLTGWVNRALPHYGTYLEDGRYASTWVPGGASQNSLAGALEGKNDLSKDEYVLNMSGIYEIIEGLKLTGMAAVTKNHDLRKIFRPEILIYNPKTFEGQAQGFGGSPLSAANSYNSRTRITLNARLDYAKTFGENHNITLLAGFNQDTDKIDYLNASKAGIPSNALNEIDAGSIDPTAGGGHIDFGLQSWFGRATYNYKEKYLLEANVRYDGSSNFAEGNKWGIFPSVSAGWRVSEEDFMKDSRVINNLKLRGSWGQLGNQDIGPNRYSATYSLGQNYSYGGGLVGGAAQTSLPNPDITWETSTQFNVGFDLNAWDGKLGLVVDYFDKTTDDILRSTSISSVIGGLAPPLVNLASVKNTGMEFAVTHNNRLGDFTYGISFNYTSINNEITKIAAPQYGGYTRLEEGYSIREFYVVKAIGIFQNEAEVIAHGAQPGAQPGDVKFEDLDNSGFIDGDDRQAAGSSIPTSSYGGNISAGYKGFDFALMLQGFGGIKAITEHEQKPFFNGAGVPTFWQNNAWTAENPNNSYPRLTRSSNYINNAWRTSSFLLEDSSFTRIKNIQLGYSLADDILEKINIDKLRVYVNAQNPFTFTKYRGLDPEKNVTAGRGSYSNVIIYSLGINLSL